MWPFMQSRGSPPSFIYQLLTSTFSAQQAQTVKQEGANTCTNLSLAKYRA